MKLIGAGLPRSGTLSTRSALESLDYAPCFHGDTLAAHQLTGPVTAFYRGEKEPLLNELKSYRAMLDFPLVALVDELIEHYPDARVLLTVRDSAEVWVRSFRQTVWKLMQLPWYTRIHSWFGGTPVTVVSPEFNQLFDLFFQRIVDRGNRTATEQQRLRRYNRDFTDDEYALMYDNWIEFIRKIVPRERLLVFNVKQGVAPLADFCQKPTPVWPMPNVNDKKRFGFLMEYLKELCWFSFLPGQKRMTTKPHLTRLWRFACMG